MTQTQSHKRDIRAFLQTDVWTTKPVKPKPSNRPDWKVNDKSSA